jgi:hypothetical protein
MRHLIAAVLLLLAPLCAAAQQRHYAVLSLVGDQLLVVQRQMGTGSNIDKNERFAVPMPDATLDRTVVLAVDEALRAADASAQPVLLGARDPALYAVAQKSLDSGGTARVFEAVRPVVANAKATHLILVTKHRHRAMLRLKGGHVGSGHLEGLGFYLDHGNGEGGINATDTDRGFISPFAYLTVSVIDLARGAVVAEEYAVGSSAYSPLSGHIGNAWSALTPEEKDRQLKALIREETARVIPKLVGRDVSR